MAKVIKNVKVKNINGDFVEPIPFAVESDNVIESDAKQLISKAEKEKLAQAVLKDNDGTVVLGKNAVPDSSNKYSFVVGCGRTSVEPKNAVAVDWAGNFYIQKDGQEVNLIEVINGLINRIEVLENRIRYGDADPSTLPNPAEGQIYIHYGGK